mgnify:CR=1 FL=1
MNKKEIPYKIYLEEKEMPSKWYNVRADMKTKPAPLLNPATLEPMTAKELGAVFCDELVRQELDDVNPYIDIPQEILDFYKMYRPSPLVRAYCLEKKLQTPAKIYYKFEGNAPEYISRELRECAEMVSSLDEKMLSLNRAILDCLREQEELRISTKRNERSHTSRVAMSGLS